MRDDWSKCYGILVKFEISLHFWELRVVRRFKPTDLNLILPIPASLLNVLYLPVVSSLHT